MRVEQTRRGPLLRLVKEEIVEDALGWISSTYGSGEGGELDAALLRAPKSFLTPEQDRKLLPDSGAARELSEASILRLREEAARVSHDPF